MYVYLINRLLLLVRYFDVTCHHTFCWSITRQSAYVRLFRLHRYHNMIMKGQNFGTVHTEFELTYSAIVNLVNPRSP